MIGKRLKTLRKDVLKINQSEFSKILGISQGALSCIEKGDRGVPITAIQKLAEYSLIDGRVDIIWILIGTNSGKINAREASILELFKVLDEHGKKAVEMIANYEYESEKCSL